MADYGFPAGTSTTVKEEDGGMCAPHELLIATVPSVKNAWENTLLRTHTHDEPNDSPSCPPQTTVATYALGGGIRTCSSIPWEIVAPYDEDVARDIVTRRSESAAAEKAYGTKGGKEVMRRTPLFVMPLEVLANAPFQYIVVLNSTWANAEVRRNLSKPAPPPPSPVAMPKQFKNCKISSGRNPPNSKPSKAKAVNASPPT